MFIPDGILYWSDATPNHVAIRHGERVLTYADLGDRVRRIAAGVARDCAPRTAVAMLVDDPIDFITTFLGIVESRCIAIPLASGWTDAEQADVLARSSPAMLVVEHDRPAAIRTRTVGTLVATVPADLRMLARSSADPFYIGFTSGSSGTPKGVIRSHRAWLNSFQLMTLLFGIQPDEDVVVPGSLFFSFSLVAALHTLHIGGRLGLPDAPSALGLLSTLRTSQGATLYTLPSTLVDTMRLAARRRARLQGVRRIITAGEKLEAAAKEHVARIFPEAALFEYYGASELGYVSVLRPEEQASRPDSVGRVVPGATIAILDERGEPVPVGEPGLLCARTEYGFSGYLDDPRGVEAVDHFGWRTVGDLARLDADGFLYLVGRRDNMVVIRGENVFPEEAEALLLAAPGVTRAVALPEPPSSPAHLAAFVEVSAPVVTHDLQARCRAKLSGPRMPRRIVVVDRVPTTSTGKLDRAAAAKLFLPASDGA